MKGFKQHPKMSHGGHYCWGGKVMKKAEGGKVGKDKGSDDGAKPLSLPDEPFDILEQSLKGKDAKDYERRERESGRGKRIFAKGGDVKKDDIEFEEMPSGAKQWVRGKNRGEKDDILRSHEENEIRNQREDDDNFEKYAKNFKKISNARTDNLNAWKRGGKVKPFWETKNPKKESKKLTPMQKASAKARAAKAGRPYPNLIDNAAAARRAK